MYHIIKNVCFTGRLIYFSDKNTCFCNNWHDFVFEKNKWTWYVETAIRELNRIFANKWFNTHRYFCVYILVILYFIIHCTFGNYVLLRFSNIYLFCYNLRSKGFRILWVYIRFRLLILTTIGLKNGLFT